MDSRAGNVQASCAMPWSTIQPRRLTHLVSFLRRRESRDRESPCQASLHPLRWRCPRDPLAERLVAEQTFGDPFTGQGNRVKTDPGNPRGIDSLD